MPYIYEIHDNELGTIEVHSSTRASRISFKGRMGRIIATIPARNICRTEYLKELIEKHRAALHRVLKKSALRHESSALHNGKEIKIPEATLLLRADSQVGRGHIRTRQEENHIIFSYHPDDLLQEPFRQGFARFIIRTLTQLYGRHLQEMVAQEASRWGVHPKGVRIGRGQRILGHCSRQGIITISAFVLLLPQHLRQYIVCHELAHLTHFNHSSHFHTLCNQYCHGNESVWARELRKFVFPISL